MNTSSKSGEIVLTLTVISLGMMLIGTMFGSVGLQKKPTSNKSQAAGSCFYHAVAYVDKVVNGKRVRLTKSDYQNQPLMITNGLGYSSNLFDTPANPQSGQVEAVYEYPKNGIGAGNFKFGRHPTGYEDGDLTYVTLNLNNKWRVTQSECIPFMNTLDGTPDKGCNGNTIKLTSNPTISNFLVTCGVSMQYGWVVEPVNNPSGGLTPSPKPSAVPTTQAGIPAQCPYVATAQVLLANQTPLSFSENGGSANFGISNDKQSQTIPAGKFGDSYLYGIKSSNAVKYAEYQYASDYEQFKPENPNALYTHEAKPNGANVTLLGLGAGWKITGTFCRPGSGALYGDKGCPTSKDQGRDVTIFRGFKPDCGVNINYGWYVEQAPTPTRYPTIPLTRPTISTNPRYPILPSKTPTALPTKIPSPVPSATTVPIPSTVTGHINIPVTEDAMIASGPYWKNRNLGMEFNIGVGWEYDPSKNPNDSANYDSKESYLKFDLSNLRGIQVRNVLLSLDSTRCTGMPEDLYLIYESNNSWSEKTITWNNKPGPNRLQQVEFINIGCGPHLEKTHSNPAELTEWVQRWIDNSSSNKGIILTEKDRPTASNKFNDFTSKEGGGIHESPYLSIDFEGTPINPIPNNKPTTPKAPVKSTLARRDLNGDGTVNVVDFVRILKKLGTKGANMPEDFNNDGVVNTIDAASVIANFGKK